jgi:holliday junction resolvase Hjr
MSLKSKGISAERELVHILQEKGFSAIRVAGSGNTKAPSTDILAGNGKRTLSIECKTLRTGYRYIPASEINEFLEFSYKFGAEAWIGARFMRKPWVFIRVDDLVKTEKNYGITPQIAEKFGIPLESFL